MNETNATLVIEEKDGELTYSVQYNPEKPEGSTPKSWIVMAGLVKVLAGEGIDKE